MYRPTPNLMQRVHLIPRIAAVVEVLEEEGISASRTLAETGLEEADLRLPDTRVSYRQVEAVFRNATRLTKNPRSPSAPDSACMCAPTACSAMRC